VLGSNVLKSDDGGYNWSTLCNPNLNQTTAVLAHPTNSSIVYAGGGMPAVVSRSTDFGHTWSLISPNFFSIGNVDRLVMDRNNPNTIYALVSGGDVRIYYAGYKSTDGGVSWNWFGLEASALAIDPGNENILYAGTNGAGIFKSTDGG